MNACRYHHHRKRSRPRRPRGIVLVVLVVLLSVSLTLFGIWAHRAVHEQAQLEMQQKRLQAIRLAEAGIERAIARRAADPQFEHEIWSVPAVELDQKHAGEVRIRIVPGKEQGPSRYEATAEFPVGELRHVQITKSLEVPQENPSDQS